MVDAATIQYVGTIGGIGAVFGFVILGGVFWFLRRLLEIYAADQEYRRQRDDKQIAAFEVFSIALTKVVERVDRLVEVDGLMERRYGNKKTDATGE